MNEPLTPALQRTAQRASFFELLRVLEARNPDATPLGTEGPVRNEAARLRGHLSLGFPVRDIAEAASVPHEGGERLQLDVSFLTLYGADAPLPVHDTIRLLRTESGDNRARDFLDVFNHRLLSIMYRAWARSRPSASGARWGSTAAGRMLVALVDPDGTLGPAAWTRPDLRFAGRRGASGLARRIEALLPGRPVRVESGVPQRVDIPDDQRCRLGLGATRLGDDCVLGGSTWDATGRFRVHLGPLDRADFEALVPGSPLHREISELVEAWMATPLDWSLRVTLQANAASPARLGASGPGTRLGVDAWLGKAGNHILSTELKPFVANG